jgi:hypothetical protein
MSMADLIQWGRTAQRTGLLRLSDGQGKEIRVVFRSGRIVFSSTNEKREQWGAYLVYLGLATEAEIDQAVRQGEATAASSASILVEEKKISIEQALATLKEKTIEDLCDVFIWQGGEFHFEPVMPVIETSLTIDLDPIHIVFEGVRRAEVWSRLNAYIHPRSFFETTESAGVDTGHWEDERMARHVRQYLDGSIMVGELVERLPFSRYKIYRAVAELLDRKLITASEVSAAGDQTKRLERKIAEAREAARAGRWSETIEILQGLVTSNPGREDLVHELSIATQGFERAIYKENFTKDDVPVVTIGPDALTRVNIYPTEGFLLSRIDGRMSVRDVLRITPVGEVEGLRAFKRLLAAKVIDFPFRKTT